MVVVLLSVLRCMDSLMFFLQFPSGHSVPRAFAGASLTRGSSRYCPLVGAKRFLGPLLSSGRVKKMTAPSKHEPRGPRGSLALSCRALNVPRRSKFWFSTPGATAFFVSLRQEITGVTLQRADKVVSQGRR